MDNAATLAGQPTHDPDSYADFVLARMREHGMEPATTLAWVCPVVWGFGDMARRLGFSGVVVDLVDDQRSWKMDGPRRARMQAEYAATLGCADLVLTNCAGNRDRFLALHPDIHVVPNGAEFEPPDPATAVPAALAALTGPVLGYVGNLRDRVDWELVAAIAAARPEWSIVLLGPRDNPEAEAAIAGHANVHLPGPVPYETMRACLRRFDVAIVPHKVDAMTDAMNPLKVYNYLAAGRPVVATAVANLDDVADLIAVAADAPGFIAAVERALPGGAGRMLSAERQAALSWSGRVAAMLRLLDGPSRPLRDEGEGGDRQARWLVGDDARRQADIGEAVGQVGAELGVDQ